jgi:CheY-like chemotaxis protein
MNPSVVLIVEDEDAVRELLAAVVEGLGRETALARDGEEALDLAGRVRPGLILLDRLLPRLGGEEIARSLKADPLTRDIPILAITASSAPQCVDELLAAGCAAVLPKPFELDDLEAELRQHLN